MTSDRRNFLKAGLVGSPGWPPCRCSAAWPVAQQTRAAQAETRVRAGDCEKVTDRVSVITGAPGNVLVLCIGRRRRAGRQRLSCVGACRAQAAWLAPACTRCSTRTITPTRPAAMRCSPRRARRSTPIRSRRQWLATDYYVPAEDRWVKAPPKEAVPTVTFREQGRDEGRRGNASSSAICSKRTRAATPMCYFRDSNVLAVGDVASPLRDPVLDWYAGGWLGGRVDAMDDLLEGRQRPDAHRAGLWPGDDARAAAGRARHDASSSTTPRRPSITRATAPRTCSTRAC